MKVTSFNSEKYLLLEDSILEMKVGKGYLEVSLCGEEFVENNTKTIDICQWGVFKLLHHLGRQPH